MIEIDGGYLEGGGQIIRTALSLSAITKKPFRIVNIRKNRKNPGLAVQHVQAIKAAANMCGVKIEAYCGQTDLEFNPGEIENRDFEISVETAGSTALIISTLLPIAYALEKEIRIKIFGGGTWNKHAPPVDYIKRVILPILSLIGMKAEIEIIREGFYPKGGAEIELRIFPWKERKMLVLKKDITRISIYSYATKSLQKARVAERMIDSASETFEGLDYKIEKNINYLNDYISEGCGIIVVSSPLILAGDAVGERGRRAEDVGKGAVEKLVREIKENRDVDLHAADQLMIYLALLGEGRINAEITNHSRTNAYVIEKFLDVVFSFKDNIMGCKRK